MPKHNQRSAALREVGLDELKAVNGGTHDWRYYAYDYRPSDLGRYTWDERSRGRDYAYYSGRTTTYASRSTYESNGSWSSYSFQSGTSGCDFV